MYKAMIVDDEPLTIEYLRQNIPIINPKWQTVVEASDGDEAFNILNKQKVDLIITDIRMPVMDGLELCRIVLKKFPKQKIIILSGYEEFDFAKKAMELGISSYILKPIVKVELKKILDKITREIEKEKSDRLAFDAIISLSKDLKKQVIKKFLEAIISDSYLEIKSLYPILFKMKVSLMEFEGIIMIIMVNKDSIIEESISVNNIPILKLLLNEITSKIIEGEKIGRVFSDREENTVIFLNITDKKSYIEYCKKIFNKISDEYYNKTGIRISGSIGELENEILQLNLSYNTAYNIILNRLVSGENKLYMSKEDKIILNKISNISKDISSIKSGVLDNNEMVYLIAISKYVEQMSSLAISEILRFGVHLISSLEKINNFKLDEQVEEALKILKDLSHSEKKIFTKDEVIKIFKGIAIVLSESSYVEQSKKEEIDYITKAKEYIYLHYPEPLSLASIAEKVCVSPSYLSSIFHEKVGESYIKFLTRVRVEQAAKLLKSKPALKIYRIAEKVGYISVKHFSYIFKNYFNQTPSEYQEKQFNMSINN